MGRGLALFACGFFLGVVFTVWSFVAVVTWAGLQLEQALFVQTLKKVDWKISNSPESYYEFQVAQMQRMFEF